MVKSATMKALWADPNGPMRNRKRDPEKVAKAQKAATLAAHSPEAKKKRSVSMTIENKRRFRQNPNWTNNFNKETNPERILRTILLAEFPNVETQRTFGPYRIDAYLPEYHLAFEADGDYWHSTRERKAHDKKRDRWLLRHYNLPVIRIWEKELVAMEKI